MGVSPVVASIFMISVTLTGGIAIWGYVNSTSAEVTEAYGQDVVSDINNLNEDFVITYLGLNATADTVSVWLYNNGAMDTQIEQILIWSLTNSTATSIQISPTFSLAKGEVGSPSTISFSIDPGETYYVKAVAQHGSTYTTYGLAS
jgi:archaellum component FlaF (FlaF/FlaG flagellin family)